MQNQDMNSRFTTHEIEYFKSIGEYDNIANCLKFINAVNLLSKDTNVFVKKLEKIPNDPAKRDASLKICQKQDPDFYEQLLALGVVLEETKSEKKIEKVTKTAAQQAELEEMVDLAYKELKLF